MKAFAAGFILLCCCTAAIPIIKAQETYKRILDDPRAFNGPKGSVVEPSSLDSIPVGLFSPFNQDNPAAQDLNRGVKLAIEQANAAGGFQGVDFSLVQRWAGSPWAAGSKEVIRLVYGDRVWAIIAFRDGAGHIAQQVAAKAYVPVIAPLSSDVSLTHSGVPWIFRLPPDDRVQARLLVKDSIAKKYFSRVGLVSGTDQNSRAAGAAMEKELKRQNIPPIFHFQVSPGIIDFQALVERIRGFAPNVLIPCLQSPVLPKLLKTLQRNGIDCSLSMPWVPGVEVKKLQAIYQGLINIVEPFQVLDGEKLGEIYQRFSRDYEKRYSVFPTYSAAYAYDSAQMIIHSIRSKGLNRPAIRLGLEELAGYEGVSGTVKWDNGGGNPGNPVLNDCRVLKPE